MTNGATVKTIDYNSFGSQIDAEARNQMKNACRLPVAVAGALMPDAHVGYGLPIGGVLATDGAVIPYAVGVDIACRVMVSVFDTTPEDLQRHLEKYKNALQMNTAFGVGAKWKKPKNHRVMDEDWNITPVTAPLKDLAWSQLGTSGSGNHFVEFGELDVPRDYGDLRKGKYIGLVSHSGSRGPGSKVANYYSKLARSKHSDLPPELAHLSWLDMKEEGAEYWAAMELMGQYASANHHIIHRDISAAISQPPIFQVENHHNFAWKEEVDGSELIVHRKGATPAHKGVLGFIPGSMVAPGFLVEGKGNADALHSAAHGAGRAMSRKQAKKTITRADLHKVVEAHGVELLSAGLDEAPHAYKDISKVMKEQESLVTTIATFHPKIVLMAPEGERAED